MALWSTLPLQDSSIPNAPVAYSADVKRFVMKEIINGVTESLNHHEVMCVAREVRTEGKLGGQARVANVGGTWKDLAGRITSTSWRPI